MNLYIVLLTLSLIKAVGRGTWPWPCGFLPLAYCACLVSILSFVYLYLPIERKRVSKTRLDLVLTARKVT